jgi:hypothetical protein
MCAELAFDMPAYLVVDAHLDTRKHQRRDGSCGQ